jgi:hypothetical protein
MDGVDFAQASTACQFRREAEIIDVAALGAGLKNPAP